jgi:quercetin dioxygenase-like cupin family protein
MNPIRRIPSRIAVPLSVMATGIVGLALMLVFDIGSTQQGNFRGGNPSILDLEGVQLLRLEFPAGSRSNWHSHADGQLLMVETGRGRTQDRGRPVKEVHPGEPWYTPAGVEHWHGAAPDVAVRQWTIYGGEVNWLEGVTDEEYLAEITR